MASKETTSSRSGSQESGASPRTPWGNLGRKFGYESGNSHGGERHIDLPVPDSGMSNSFTEGRQDGATTQDASEPEGRKDNKKSPEALTPDDAIGAGTAELQNIIDLKNLKRERSFVAKKLAEATRDINNYKPGDSEYERLLPEVTNLRDRLDSINEQMGQIETKKGRSGDKKESKGLATTSKELGRVADPDKLINDPESKLKQKVDHARNEYAKLRAEYEQMGMFKNLLKGKELKKMMELARAELEGFMTQLVYQQKDEERSIIVNGVEGANEKEQKEARQKAVQSIAAAVLEQHALVDEKTQEEYDKRLDERSLFKKVAAKIGRWFVGKENKDGGKLGLAEEQWNWFGGWCRYWLVRCRLSDHFSSGCCWWCGCKSCSSPTGVRECARRKARTRR